jgi:ACR3 family arsenite transporter
VQNSDPLGWFGRYLTLWVALSGGLGVVVGHFAPSVPRALEEATVSQISLPVAVLIWIMVFPMIAQIDLKSIKAVRRNLIPVGVTSGINYLVQPFTMYALARLFFNVIFSSTINDPKLEDEYVAGSVVLGGSPCTAMVFVWSLLCRGDAAYTLVQVAVNDILIFVFYIPTLMLLLQVTNIIVPWDTAFLSLVVFMLVPGAGGYALRTWAQRYRSQEWLDRLIGRMQPITAIALLLTVLLIFIFQGAQIVESPVDVLLIAVPLILQSYLIFVLAYGVFYLLRVPYRFAAPGAMIATSNFFEMAVAVAMSLFGADSGATLATVVGVLVEVPVMLSLVWIANRTRHWFPQARTERDYLLQLEHELDEIPLERQQQLQSLAKDVYATSKTAKDGMMRAVFVCTHNSRRSQFCEAWARIAAVYCGLQDVAVFSGGTTVTCVNQSVLRALQRCGVRWRVADNSTDSANPRYTLTTPGLAGVSSPPMYSKLYGDAANPSDSFVAVMVCSGAHAACPFVSGASQRVALPYFDPKASDSTPIEMATYDHTCRVIAREMLFVMRSISKSPEEILVDSGAEPSADRGILISHV